MHPNQTNEQYKAVLRLLNSFLTSLLAVKNVKRHISKFKEGVHKHNRVLGLCQLFH